MVIVKIIHLQYTYSSKKVAGVVMDRIDFLISRIFKIPFLIVAFLVYLPVYALDVLWNLIIEEKPVPVQVRVFR